MIAALTGYDFRGNSDYKLFDRRAVAALQMDERRTFFRGLVEWAGFRHQTIKCDVTFFVVAVVLGARTIWLYWRGTAPGAVTAVILVLLILGSFVLLALAVISESIAAIYEDERATALRRCGEV